MSQRTFWSPQDTTGSHDMWLEKEREAKIGGSGIFRVRNLAESVQGSFHLATAGNTTSGTVWIERFWTPGIQKQLIWIILAQDLMKLQSPEGMTGVGGSISKMTDDGSSTEIPQHIHLSNLFNMSCLESKPCFKLRDYFFLILWWLLIA
jgi:hypothetical protein